MEITTTGVTEGYDLGGKIAIVTGASPSVRELVRFVTKSGDRIDHLFLNARVFNAPYEITEDGFEYTCAANYIGHFFLVHELASARALSARKCVDPDDAARAWNATEALFGLRPFGSW